jgi:hypothetical protein
VGKHPIKEKEMITPQAILIKAVLINSLSLVKKAIKLGADPASEDSFAFTLSAYEGHLEIVKLLAPLSDVKVGNSLPLKFAVMGGHTQVVEELEKHYTKQELRDFYANTLSKCS